MGLRLGSTVKMQKMDMRGLYIKLVAKSSPVHRGDRMT